MNFKQLRERYRSKFPAEMVAAAVKIALDMGGNMTGAYKKIEKMRRGLGDDPIVADALRLANESVQEKMSAAQKKKRLDMIRKAVEKLNMKADAQARKDALAAIKAMESVEESIEEMNGQTGPVLNIGYRPQRQGGKLGSHSTITKSDLYEDATNNKKNWSITANTNSLAFRLPHPKGHEKDRKDWMDLLDSAKGDTSNMIRGGGFTKSEVQELKRDYEKAIKAFGGTKVVSQIHEIYVRHNKPGGLKVKAGLLAMLKALDEFGMRNHVSLSSRDGVLTRIQDTGQYNYNESVNENLSALEKPARVKASQMSMMQKKMLMKHYKDLANGKQSALAKIMKILKDDTDLEEKGKGLWHNIQQRRKSGKKMRKKGEKGAPTAAAMRQAKGESVNEDSFQLVNMSRRTAKIADKLAKRVGLDTDFEGGVLGINLTVHGTKKKIEKWLHSLPLDNVDEGMYTKDDGGAYDGLRIAKYLAHQDGKDFKRLPYGTMQGYIDKGMDMLKRDKSKARDILSKPTPR